MLSFKQDKEWKKYVKNAIGLIVFFVNTICGYANEAKEEGKKEELKLKDSVTLGKMTENSMALGKNSSADANYSVALGLQAKASNQVKKYNSEKEYETRNADGMVAIGYDAVVETHSSVAIGREAKTWAREEKTKGQLNRNNVSIGYMSQSGEAYSTGLGSRTRANGRFSTAIGSDAWIQEGGSRAVAIGNRATIGDDYKVASNGGGYDSREDFIRELDPDRTEKQYGAVAIGRYSHVSMANGVALGHMAEVKQNNSVAIGVLSEANEVENGVALGSFSNVDRDRYELGYDPETGKDREITGSEVDKIKEFNKILAKVERYKELDLKASEMTAEEKEEYDKLCDENIEYEIYNGKEIENRTDSVSLFYDDENLSARIKQLEKEQDKNNKTWRSTSGAVSVGNAKKWITRQITNVAAGSEDTDAVNVAQLKSSVKMINNVDKKVTEVRNGEAGIAVYTDKSGNRVKKAANGNYYIEDAFRPDGVLTEDSSKKVVDSDNIVISLAGKNMSTNNNIILRNVAAGQADNDAVNVGQLNAKEASLKAEISTVNNEVTKVESEVANLDSKVDTKVKELDGKIAGVDTSLKETAQNLEKKIEKNKNDITALDKKITGVDKKVGAKTDELQKGLNQANNNISKIDIKVENVQNNKLNKDLANLTLEGSTVISNIAKDSIELKAGAGINIKQKDKGNKVIYTIANTIKYQSNGALDNQDEVDSKKPKNRSKRDLDNISNKPIDTTEIVSADKGLNFIDGKNTIATTASQGVVSYHLAKNLEDIETISSKKEKDLMLTGNGSSIKLTKDKIEINNKVVSGIGEGKIEKNSTDAVNGAQLYEIKEEISTKANKDLDNLSINGKNQVKELAQSSIQVKGQGKIKVTKEKDGDKEVYTVTSTSQELIGYKTKEGKELILRENELFIKDGDAERKATEEEKANHKAHLKNAKGKMDKEVKLSNVADGEISEKSTDAVNGRQVNRVRNEVRTALNQTNTRIDRLEENMARQNERIDNLRKDLNNGMAQLSAMSAVDFGHTKKHKVKVGAGIGGYKGARAVAVGVAVSPTDNLLINAKMSTSTNTIKGTSFGIGATYEFDYE